MGLFECPEFVPRVDVFVSALRGLPLPTRTLALLMQYYERTGSFAKAEDAFFALLDVEPGNSRLIDFGIAFYQRLQRREATRRLWLGTCHAPKWKQVWATPRSENRTGRHHREHTPFSGRQSGVRPF